MHFVVLGAGAIGCYVGGRLALSGCKVTLVGRPRIVEDIATHGLHVSDLEGFDTWLPADGIGLVASLQEACLLHEGEPLVILLCVKGGGSAAAASEIAACCPSDTPVLSLQNGVDNVARIKAAAPQMQVLAGMVAYNVVMPDEHQVHRATDGLLYLQHCAVTEALLAPLQAAGLATSLEADMPSVQWGKLLLNLNNPVNALSGLPLRQQLLDRDCRRVLATLQDEALAALARAGIQPAKIGSAPPRLLPRLLRLPTWLFARIAARMLRIDARARSSMADDLRMGRGTEIDDFCGAVVRLASAHDLTAPGNAAMCRLVTEHQPGQQFSGAQLRRAIGI